MDDTTSVTERCACGRLVDDDGWLRGFGMCRPCVLEAKAKESGHVPYRAPTPAEKRATTKRKAQTRAKAKAARKARRKGRRR